MALPIPDHYRLRPVDAIFVEDAARVTEEAEAYRRRYRIRDAREDRFRTAVLAVDCQVTFCIPGASLFVPGAVEDVARAVQWLYRHLDRITTLVFTLDTHSVFQIFHPASWVDQEGRHPAPFTVISADDVRSGRWIPQLRAEAFPDMRAACIEYCEALAAGGRYVLTIWPYHALLGGVSHALVPAMHEAALFHAVARRTDPTFEMKGRAAMTENYSVLAPEVRRVGELEVGVFNTQLFERLMAHDRIYVLGQAKSHCVLFTLRDLRRECEQRDPSLLDRIWILEDAMSPVTPPPLDPLPPALDFPKVADQGIAELAAAGMHVVRTSDPVPD
jgi:nicotinamidase-related amidase